MSIATNANSLAVSQFAGARKDLPPPSVSLTETLFVETLQVDGIWGPNTGWEGWLTFDGYYNFSKIASNRAFPYKKKFANGDLNSTQIRIKSSATENGGGTFSAWVGYHEVQVYYIDGPYSAAYVTIEFRDKLSHQSIGSVSWMVHLYEW